MFTVDAASRSKRTLDQRTKGVSDTPPPSAKEQGSGGQKPSKAAGISQAISGYQDDNLVWDDINFIKKNTKLPILVKGIQCMEDAEIAAEYGVAGVILVRRGGANVAHRLKADVSRVYLRLWPHTVESRRQTTELVSRVGYCKRFVWIRA